MAKGKNGNELWKWVANGSNNQAVLLLWPYGTHCIYICKETIEMTFL